ncbi:MAG: Asp23/Gls24 family envelope stress response protein, partial [Peptococcaceae bacterium]|nr:Asp23/Gls24 family envelope stress response protein [Peptococcaceae bacterium]
MRGYKKTDLGQVVIDPKVVVSYASDVANSTPGIVGMAFVDAKDGIAKLLKREAAYKGIKVIIEDNKVTINYHLIIKFGVNVLSVQQNLLDSV